MPSVLVETGYISNATDEKFLLSWQGQDFISSAIFRAFKLMLTSGNNLAQASSGDTLPDSSAHKTPVATVRKPETSSPVKAKLPAAEKEGKNVVEKTPEKKPVTGTDLEFRIQIATSATDLPETSRIYAQFKSVKMYRHKGLNKYTVGNYSELVKAKGMLEEVKKKGYRDAFIVIFRDNERIPQAEADRIFRE
jgi:N-acetylmuramoyl-L-alanine amidase